MVGDWQHAESPLMRARMSGWADHAEDGSRYVARFNEEAALEEARSILAETEPSGLSAVDQDWPHRYAPHSAYYSALAESLRSFVEGN